MNRHIRNSLGMLILVTLTQNAFAASRRTPVVEAIEKSSPAVVNISTERVIRQQYGPSFGMRDRMFDDLFNDFWNRYHRREYRKSSLGSGVIIDPSGIVVTNEHVINRASKITVALPNGQQYEAALISSDPDNDLAVLKINANEDLPCIEMGTSSDLMIGETVIAIGNPFGLQNSVSSGVLSATDRSVQSEGHTVLEHLVQIDAAINPGNSGGALVNINGQLIGINTAIVAEAQGIGFALPVDRVKAVLSDLLDYRLLKRMWLGVRFQEITPELAGNLDIEGKGALVTDVEKDSPAQSAGLQTGDVIYELDGAQIAHPYEFALAMLHKKAGDRVAIRYSRGRNRRSARLTIQKLPKKSAFDLAKEKFGFELQQLTDRQARSLNIDPQIGLIVTAIEQGSPAEYAQIQNGDLVLRIAGRPVSNLDNFAALLEKLKTGDRVMVILYRHNTLYKGVLKVR